MSVLDTDVRELGKIPDEVEIVRVLRLDPDTNQFQWPKMTYVHIRHRFCFRHMRGSMLCIERLSEFLERFEGLLKDEPEIVKGQKETGFYG